MNFSNLGQIVAVLYKIARSSYDPNKSKSYR